MEFSGIGIDKIELTPCLFATLITFHVLVMGDFNHPDIDWNTRNAEKGINHRSQFFPNLARDAYLIQYVDTPIRFSLWRKFERKLEIPQVQGEEQKRLW